jgi:type IV pilus assembly protein PilB
MAKRVGEILIEADLITEEQVQAALELQKKNGGMLGELLVELGYVTEADVAEALSKKFGLPLINLDEIEIKREIINLIPQDLATRYKIVPVKRKGRKGLIVAVSEPTNIEAIDDIRFRTGFDVIAYFSPISQIEDALVKYYHADNIIPTEVKEKIEIIGEDEESSQITGGDKQPGRKLVTSIIWDALNAGATEIHLTPFRNRISVKYRIDGMLDERQALPLKTKSPIVSYLTTSAKFDLKTKGIPQTGHFAFRASNQTIKVIVRSLPTHYGDKFTVTLNKPFNEGAKLESLGFTKKAWEKLDEVINSRYGIVLISGPRNREKINTFYTFLSHYIDSEYNIVTAEKPVQSYIDSITQVEVDHSHSLSFQRILDTFLHERAEVFGISDVSDPEVLSLAIQLSYSSLVYCLVDAKDSFSAISYLLGKATNPEMLAASLNCVISQRVLHKLCLECKTKTHLSEADLSHLGIKSQKLANHTFYSPAGCKKCNNSGYHGQEAVFEVLPITKKIGEAISREAHMTDIYIQAKKEGFRSLKEESIMKLIKGITSYEEILREFYN